MIKRWRNSKRFLKTFLVISLFTVSICSQAQNSRKNSFGIFAGVGGASVAQEGLEGGGSTDMNTGLSIGLNYYRSLSAKTLFETGIVWYMNEVAFTGAYNPNYSQETLREKVQLIYIPLFVRFDVSKVFFLHVGLIGDLDVSNNDYLDNQTGLGSGIGLGINFPLSEKIKLQINPFMNIHGLLMTEKQSYPQRILETGIKLGIRTY